MKVHTIEAKAKEHLAIEIEPTTAGKREHTSLSQREIYTPGWTTVRAGSDKALEIPSRVGNRKHYRDGRVELVA
jgi:hypothetical protein